MAFSLEALTCGRCSAPLLSIRDFLNADLAERDRNEFEALLAAGEGLDSLDAVELSITWQDATDPGRSTHDPLASQQVADVIRAVRKMKANV